MPVHAMNVDQCSRGQQGHMGCTKHGLGIVCRQRSAEQDEQDGQNRRCKKSGKGERKESGLRDAVSNYIEAWIRA